MDKALKDKWSAALRSGEYQQGKCALLSEGRYCCLGVLCVLLGREIKDTLDSDCNNDRLIYKALDCILGIETRDKFVEMNDERGNDFTEIADYIDTNL